MKSLLFLLSLILSLSFDLISIQKYNPFFILWKNTGLMIIER